MSSRFTQRRRDLAKIKDLTRCLHRSKRYQLYGVLEVFGLLAIVSNLRASRAANNSICACKFFTSSRQQTIGKLEGGIGGTYLHLLLLFLDHYYPSMLATFLVITGRAHRTNCGPRTTWKTVVKVAQKTHFTLGFVSGWVRYDYCCCSLFLCVSHPLWL